MKIKPSGKNTHVGYDYFDLSDILPAVTELEKIHKMLSVVRFCDDYASLTVYNSEKTDEFIEFTSPMSTADLKGCHAVQNLGAVETYIRRYLYMIAYEIVEHESLDLTHGKDNTKKAGSRQGQSAPATVVPMQQRPVQQPQQPPHPQAQTESLLCSQCGAVITNAEANYSEKKFGAKLCRMCQKGA